MSYKITGYECSSASWLCFQTCSFSLSFWSKSRALKIFTLIVKTSCPMVTAVILHQECGTIKYHMAKSNWQLLLWMTDLKWQSLILHERVMVKDSKARAITGNKRNMWIFFSICYLTICFAVILHLSSNKTSSFYSQKLLFYRVRKRSVCSCTPFNERLNRTERETVIHFL